ncbi:TonB-dependent receptor plug domain-containing protein [Pseudoxanthomonas dokdonensis]|uniref:TonB-dependent receptor n=1 Tax=Pseudoxanthomonas dokdonensis TaxID=344882 RepID=A0A0R0CPD9_9GAMM|nr:TonB-dependent receptor [Pseudoxanthomonas dokdonensis]KRG68290.1 TonB-dependent receptor [Pseudoxanthomonas dokdonensis]
MTITKKLPGAIKIALFTGAAMATSTALAQDAPPASTEATTLDRVEVTGSRIRQVDKETAAPVLTIDRAAIEDQGFNNVAEILQNVSAFGSPPISRTDPLQSGEAVGGQYVDLRGLGSQRTLVLVDGKRLGITNGGRQDVASIPAAAVERIEILKDGASSIYGSDAMAGVVNIITRKNFDGLEANAYLGQYSQGDGQRQQYSFLMGTSGDRGSLTAGVEYTKEDPVWTKDRWFSRTSYPSYEKGDRLKFDGSGTIKDGAIVTPDGNMTLDRTTSNYDTSDINNFRPTDADGLDATFPALASTLQTGVERKSAFLNGTYNITDDVRFSTDFLYTDRDSFAQNAGYPYRSASWGTPLSGESVFNPLGEEAEFIRRGWEVPRGVFNNLTTFRWTGTLAGSFQIGEHFWDWDAGMLYNQNKGTQVSTGNLNTANVGLAVGPSFINAAGQVQCGTAADPIPLGIGPGNCTPWNPLIPEGVQGYNGLADPAVQAYLYQPGQAVSETTTRDYFANLSGSLATLPAGDLGMAVGIEHRNERGSFSPDALAQTGISTDLASGPTAGGYSLDEAYLEFLVPVLADVPGAQLLSFTAATRYSDYDTFGDTLNSKFGFTWKPVDSLLVRGTWAEGFRAPSVASLYGGTSDSFAYYSDPCDTAFGEAAGNSRCLQDVPVDFRQAANRVPPVSATATDQSNIPFRSGANPDLTPETSESQTLGLVWSPSFARGLNAALDWWKIRIDNTIVDDSPTDILDDCYLRGIESRCSGKFTRDPVTGAITSMAYSERNAGYRETEGFDLDLNYALDTDWGRFDLQSQSTYVVKSELKTDNTDSPPQQLNGFGGDFRLRSNLALGWTRGDFGLTWNMRYYSGVKSGCLRDPDGKFYEGRCSLPEFTAPDLNGEISAQNELGANTFHDLQVRWNAPWNGTVSLGINNVFDHNANADYDTPSSGYAYYGGYDIGRFMYMKYQQRF